MIYKLIPVIFFIAACAGEIEPPTRFGYDSPEYTPMGILFHDETKTTDVVDGTEIDNAYLSVMHCYSYIEIIPVGLTITVVNYADVKATGWYFPPTTIVVETSYRSTQPMQILKHEFVHYFDYIIHGALDYNHMSEKFIRCLN